MVTKAFYHGDYPVEERIGMKDTDKNVLDELCWKYRWLHRTHVLAIFLAVFYEYGRYTNNPWAVYLIFPIALFYAVYPRGIEYVFRCSDKYYVITFVITALLFVANAATVSAHMAFMSQYVGGYTVALGAIIFLISFFMLGKINPEKY